VKNYGPTGVFFGQERGGEKEHAGPEKAESGSKEGELEMSASRVIKKKRRRYKPRRPKGKRFGRKGTSWHGRLKNHAALEQLGKNNWRLKWNRLKTSGNGERPYENPKL